jgi:phage shock protein A
LANVKEEHKRLKAKRAELAERARKAAEIKQAAQASASGSPAGCRGQVLNAGSASRGFERMEDKIAMQEALAEQSGLAAAAAAAPESPLNSAVEAELERLRNRK